MKKRGFTIVELVITITIMGIILTLAVVSLSSSQVTARDNERKSDIEALAAQLEAFHQSGTDGSTSIGRYPSTVVTSNNLANLQNNLRDIDLEIATAPGAASAITSFIAATNATQTTAGVTPQPTISQYVYQPLQTNNTLCTTESQECRKFNLYYRLEGDNTVYMVTSKTQ